MNAECEGVIIVVRILIVDDQALVQTYLRTAVEENPAYTVVGVLEHADRAERFCANRGVDLILMDVCTADSQSGLQAAARIKRAYPRVKIVIVTSMPEVSFMDKAKAAGCESFWYKMAPRRELQQVIAATLAGERVYPLERPTVRIGNASSVEFTDKELCVLRELVEGNNQNDIAQKYGITRSAVKYHIRNMLQKTGYDSYVKLVIDVVDKRLIIPNY